MSLPWLMPDDPFPPVGRALRHPNGLLAVGADLSPDRLLAAYAQGIFPWFGEEDPILWWSPDPRMVLYTHELHVSRSLRRTLRGGRLVVTTDRAFREVLAGCAAPRDDDGTWLTPQMQDAYAELARRGRAHSVEVWDGSTLVGGLYGVALGRMFFGESMFSRRTDASKVALALLVTQLARWDFELVDCQMSTGHLASMGAREVPRAAFVESLRRHVPREPVPSPWTFDADLVAALTDCPRPVRDGF